jgi:MFS family permease
MYLEEVLRRPPLAGQHLSCYSRKAVIGSAVGYAMDGFDLLILGFALTSIAATFGLSKTQAGALVTYTLVGAVLGGVLFGILADYLGRVRVLTWSIVIFAVFTGLTALAWNYPSLAVFRFISGLGLGGEFGIGMALATEASPASRRARATAWVANGWQLGTLLAALVSAVVLPLGGWRLLFALGVLPAIVAFLIRSRLNESEKFVQTRKHGRGNGFPLRLLVKDALTTRISLSVVLLTSVQNFGYYGIMIWLPTYLSSKFGLSYAKSGVWIAVAVCGMILGVYVFGWLADSIGRRPSFLIFQAGAAISVLVYAQLSTSLALLFGGAIMGIFVNGMMGGYGALMAELYPTQARATAQNVLFNIGRAIGGFAPVTFAVIAEYRGTHFAVGALAVLYLLDMAAILFIPERKGVELS